MPRVAAMMASVVLIVSSIGINIARYPTVGQLAQSPQGSQARVGDLAHQPAATPGASTEKNRVLSKVVNVDLKPTPAIHPATELVDVAPPVVSKIASPRPENPVAPDEPNKATSAATIHIVAIHPIVSPDTENPFASAQTTGQESSESVVQRLPPIDRVVPAEQPRLNPDLSDRF